MDKNRRTFLKWAGLTTAGVGVCSSVPFTVRAYQPEKEVYLEDKQELKARRWGMVIDTRKLTSDEDLERIIEACNHAHNIPENIPNPKQEIKWIWKDEYEHCFTSKENPYLAERLKDREFLLLCNHCNNPPCVRVCPTQATFRRPDGIVMMDFHRCIGCRYCMAACPYGSRSFNFRDPAPFVKDKDPTYPTRMRGVVEKCTFCMERLQEGRQPACVEAANGAIVVGDLADPDSEIRKILKENFTIRRKVELGTEPCVFYIV